VEARELEVVLLTVGDPNQVTGGHLFHRRLAELAPQNRARLHFVSFRQAPFPLATLQAPAAVRQARRLRADALVLDSIAAAFLAPQLWVNAPRLPLLGMLHQPPGGIGKGRLRTLLQRWLDKSAYRRTTLLMAASEALASELAECLPADRIRVVLPGRDVSTRLGDPPGDLRRGRQAAFLCVANWLENKGLHELLEAFAKLPEGAGTLHLVGDTAVDQRYTQRLRARLRQQDLRQRVVVHGPRTLPEVAALYQAADVFVLPSLRETFGTVYGEAMAAGLPVVGWCSGNLPNLATDGKEGLIVEPGDLGGLSRALGRLAFDEPLRQRLGAAACRRAQSRPTWADTARRFYELVREAIALSDPSQGRSEGVDAT
jgi:glycosyltransferase involved in cell wall biosynthesis